MHLRAEIACRVSKHPPVDARPQAEIVEHRKKR
jgi:hypothetical protein